MWVGLVIAVLMVHPVDRYPTGGAILKIAKPEYCKSMFQPFGTRESAMRQQPVITDRDPKHPKEEMSGEVNPAIAMALHLYQSELHDYENTVLTIQKVSRNYSPWSSKIYTLRKTPNKN